jgi:hypothetical protein
VLLGRWQSINLFKSIPLRKASMLRKQENSVQTLEDIEQFASEKTPQRHGRVPPQHQNRAWYCICGGGDAFP